MYKKKGFLNIFILIIPNEHNESFVVSLSGEGCQRDVSFGADLHGALHLPLPSRAPQRPQPDDARLRGPSCRFVRKKLFALHACLILSIITTFYFVPNLFISANF